MTLVVAFVWKILVSVCVFSFDLGRFGVKYRLVGHNCLQRRLLHSILGSQRKLLTKQSLRNHFWSCSYWLCLERLNIEWCGKAVQRKPDISNRRLMSHQMLYSLDIQ